IKDNGLNSTPIQAKSNQRQHKNDTNQIAVNFERHKALEVIFQNLDVWG
ncbi:hypothetical protein HMPREF1392_01587, partial [Helicobacter pylori GAM101Biv]